jgi:hypothetical protein
MRALQEAVFRPSTRQTWFKNDLHDQNLARFCGILPPIES